MSCGVGGRSGWDPELLWLWCRPAARAPIQPLAWELSDAKSATLKSKKAKRPRNQPVLGACATSQNGKLRMINYHCSLEFANCIILFWCA